MYIPENIINEIDKNADPLDNSYFNHALPALNAINKVDSESFCYDDLSRAANVLERLYKGFLQAAVVKTEWYQLPYEKFLVEDHDILGMLKEIKRNFPEAFPRQDYNTWRATQSFLIELRQAYSFSRYTTYPTYEEFDKVRKYVNHQKDIFVEFIKEGGLEENRDTELKEDY